MQEEETRRSVGIENKDTKEITVSQIPSEEISESKSSGAEESEDEQLEKEIAELQHRLCLCQVHRKPTQESSKEQELDREWAWPSVPPAYEEVCEKFYEDDVMYCQSKGVIFQ